MSDDALRELAKVNAAAAKAVVAGELSTPRDVSVPLDLDDDGFVTVYVSPPTGPRS